MGNDNVKSNRSLIMTEQQGKGLSESRKTGYLHEKGLTVSVK